MRYIIIGVIFLLAAVIQTNVLSYAEILGVKPNLFIIMITCFALLGGRVEGAIIGFIAGFIQDVVIANSIGGYTLLGMYLGLTVGALNRRFVKDNLLVGVMFVFLATLAYETVLYLAILLTFGQTGVIDAFRNIILPEAVYNSAAVIIVFPLVMVIYEWTKQYIKNTRKY